MDPPPRPGLRTPRAHPVEAWHLPSRCTPSALPLSGQASNGLPQVPDVDSPKDKKGGRARSCLVNMRSHTGGSLDADAELSVHSQVGPSLHSPQAEVAARRPLVTALPPMPARDPVFLAQPATSRERAQSTRERAWRERAQGSRERSLSSRDEQQRIPESLDPKRVPLCLAHLNRQLSQCKAELQHNELSLFSCQEELAACKADHSKSQGELAKCRRKLATCQQDLARCKAQLRAYHQGDTGKQAELVLEPTPLPAADLDEEPDDALERKHEALLADFDFATGVLLDLQLDKAGLLARRMSAARQRWGLEVFLVTVEAPNGLSTPHGTFDGSEVGESSKIVAAASGTPHCSSERGSFEMFDRPSWQDKMVVEPEVKLLRRPTRKVRAAATVDGSELVEQACNIALSGDGAATAVEDAEGTLAEEADGMAAAEATIDSGEVEVEDQKPPRSRGRVLWDRAWQLVLKVIGERDDRALTPSQRMFSMRLTDLFDNFACEFQGATLGIYELAEQIARDCEFNRRVHELMDVCKDTMASESRKVRIAAPAGCKQLPADEGVKALNLEEEEHQRVQNVKQQEEDLQNAMVAMYEAAFKAAGGQEIARRRFEEANRLVREHRRKCHLGRPRQDVGYEILGLDNLFDATRMVREKLVCEVERIALKTGGKAICPGLKGRDRARAKILTKYGNDTACLTDLMRASIIYPGINALYDGFFTIIQEDMSCSRRDFHVVELSDRFQVSRDGYRDISILFSVDGMIGEVQLHVQQILDAKRGGGHGAYKVQRVINELLFEACVRHNELKVYALATEYQVCASGIRDKNGRTALHYSCQHGSAVIVRLLLQQQADPWKDDDHGLLPYELALRMGHFDALWLVLLQMHDRPPHDPVLLHAVVDRGAMWWVDRMVNESTEASEVMSLMNQQLTGDRKRHTLQLLQRMPNEATQVLRSVSSQWRDVGKIMLAMIKHHGAHKPLEDFLLAKARQGDSATVCVLLEASFDVPLQHGRPSVLDAAIQGGHHHLVEDLIKYAEAGFQCCLCSTREPPHHHLREAIQEEDADRALAALRARADPNHTTARAPGKRTALMCFAAAGNLELCRELIRSSASASWIDNFRCTALDYAHAHRHDSVAAYLGGLHQSMPELHLHGIDVSQYLTNAVQTGCCGAVWRVEKLAREDKEGSWPGLREMLQSKIGPFENTVLHLAVAVARSGTDRKGQVCRALLLARADPVLANSQGETPLMAAAYTGHYELHQVLCQALHEQAPGQRNDIAAMEEESSKVLSRNIQRQEIKRMLMEKDADDVVWKEIGFMAFKLGLTGTRLEAAVERSSVGWLEALCGMKNKLDIIAGGFSDSDDNFAERQRKPLHPSRKKPPARIASTGNYLSAPEVLVKRRRATQHRRSHTVVVVEPVPGKKS